MTRRVMLAHEQAVAIVRQHTLDHLLLQDRRSSGGKDHPKTIVETACGLPMRPGTPVLFPNECGPRPFALPGFGRLNVPYRSPASRLQGDRAIGCTQKNHFLEHV